MGIIESEIIADFEEYMEENNREISVNWITNECYINNYIESTCYDETEETQNEIYEILDNYCCSIPF